MPLRDRPFAGTDDVILLRDFLSRLVARHGQAFFLHTGDFLWRLYLQEDWLGRARKNIQIWEADDGNVAGFCWFTPTKWVDFQIDPAFSDDGRLEAAMLGWTMDRATAETGARPTELHADALDSDRRRLAALESLGFIADGPQQYISYHQSLAGLQPSVQLREGVRVRSVDVEIDLEDRVAIHREVWHPSRITPELYQNVRSAPGYLADLDLVAVAPDRRFAAYTICWYDPVNQIGEFEPVGTRADYRRQGYGRAVIEEGLRRLRALGARQAIVYSAAENEASRALYEGCGFAAIGRFLDLRRTGAPA